MKEISKRLYPHLYEFFQLGAGVTEEGRKYQETYRKLIFEESKDRYYISEVRCELGTDKDIHMLESKLHFGDGEDPFFF